jgi:hypothetical protein
MGIVFMGIAFRELGELVMFLSDRHPEVIP